MLRVTFVRKTGTPAALLRYSFRTPTALLRYSYGTPAVLLRYSYGTPSGLLPYSYGTPTALLRYSYSPPTVLLLYSYGTPSALLQYSCGTPSGLLRFSYRIYSTYLSNSQKYSFMTILENYVLLTPHFSQPVWYNYYLMRTLLFPRKKDSRSNLHNAWYLAKSNQAILNLSRHQNAQCRNCGIQN